MLKYTIKWKLLILNLKKYDYCTIQTFKLFPNHQDIFAYNIKLTDTLITLYSMPPD